MGGTHVTVTIRNPADPDRFWEGLFLVDTGAVDCLVPRRHLKEIGLQPKGKRTYELADGSEIKFDITSADVEFMGDFVGATIIYGDDDVEPILGVTALESVGIEVDPTTQRLTRLPATRLKAIASVDIDFPLDRRSSEPASEFREFPVTFYLIRGLICQRQLQDIFWSIVKINVKN